MAGKTVRIDALPESAWRYRDYDAVVCIDLLLAGTTVVTAAAGGRSTYLASTDQEAFALKHRFREAMPISDFGVPVVPGFQAGFDLERLAMDDQSPRPVVFLSDVGRLPLYATGRAHVYFACLRNLEATASHIDAAGQHRVAVVGAGDAGEVRCEDQMAAVWLARQLQQRGYLAEDRSTEAEIARWSEADVSLIGWGRSAEQLRDAGRDGDVAFVMRSLDDLGVACRYEAGRVHAIPVPLASAYEELASGTFG